MNQTEIVACIYKHVGRTNDLEIITKLAGEIANLAAASEREACAKVCEDWGRECHGEGRDDSEAFDCADHIRARSTP